MKKTKNTEIVKYKFRWLILNIVLEHFKRSFLDWRIMNR